MMSSLPAHADATASSASHDERSVKLAAARKKLRKFQLDKKPERANDPEPNLTGSGVALPANNAAPPSRELIAANASAVSVTSEGPSRQDVEPQLVELPSTRLQREYEEEDNAVIDESQHKAEVQMLQRQCDELRDANMKLQQIVRDLLAPKNDVVLQDQRSRIQEYETQLTELREEIERLRAQSKQDADRIEDLESHNLDLTQKCYLLEARLGGLSPNEIVPTDVVALQNDLSMIKHQLEAKSEALESAYIEMGSLKSQYDDKLRDREKELEDSYLKLKEDDRKAKDDEIAKLNAEWKSRLEAQQKLHDEQLNATKESQNSSNDTNHALKQQVEQLTLSNTLLKQQNEKLMTITDDRASLSRKVSQMTEENKSLLMQFEEMKSLIRILQDDKLRLLSETEAKTKELEQVHDRDTALSDAKNKLVWFEKENERLVKTVEYWQSLHNEHIRKIAEEGLESSTTEDVDNDHNPNGEKEFSRRPKPSIDQFVHLETENQRLTGEIEKLKLVVENLGKSRVAHLNSPGLQNETAMIQQSAQTEVTSLARGVQIDGIADNDSTRESPNVGTTVKVNSINTSTQTQTSKTSTTDIVERTSSTTNSDINPQMTSHEQYKLETEQYIESLRQQLAQEKHLNDLLSAELDAIPDYIELYHRERRALIEQTERAIARIRDQQSQTSPQSGWPSPSQVLETTSTPVNDNTNGATSTSLQEENIVLQRDHTRLIHAATKRGAAGLTLKGRVHEFGSCGLCRGPVIVL